MAKIDLNGTLSINKVEADSITVNSASIEETISTDNEIATTTFLNGKRVYKRLYRGTMPPTTETSILRYLNFEYSTAWIDESLSFISNGTETLGVNVYFGTNEYLTTWISNETPNIRIRTGSNLSPYTYNIVVAYLKNDGSNTGEVPDKPISYQSKTISADGAKGHHKFTLEVYEEGINGNDSIIKYSFKLSPIQKGWDWSGWGSKISYTITIGDNTYTGTIPKYDGSSTVTLKSDSGIAIPHEADGTKTISIGFAVKDGANQRYTCGNASSSASMTLSTIQ